MEVLRICACPCAYQRAARAHAPNRAAPRARMPVALDMQWEQHSSQQCFAEVGTSGAGVHLLIVAVTSDGKGSERRGSNQVKVMGVYHQPLREGGLEGGDERFGRYAHFQPGLLTSVGS